MNTHQILLDEIAQLAIITDQRLDWFARRMQDLPEIEGAAQALPFLIRLPEILQLSTPQTHRAVQAICNAAATLCWQQSYTNADGFDDCYLDKYGWFNLVSHEGLFLCDALRVSIGYWGSGLCYTEHWHEPEEFYLVIAGGAEFISQGSPPRQCGPGEVIHHAPNQPHAFKMNNGPMLAVAFWRGQNLLRKPDLKETS